MTPPSHFYLLYILLFLSQQLFAKSLAQKIYELEKSVVCQNATQDEFNNLALLACKKTGETDLKVDLDLISEKIVFDKIADDEISRISCYQTQLNGLLNDESLLAKANEQSCHFLPFLEKALQNQYYYDDLLAGVNKVLRNTDLRLSPNQIQELNTKKSEYETKLRESAEVIWLIKSKDVLLSSSSVYESISLAVTGIGSSKSAKENLCGFVTRISKQSLKKDLDKNEQVKNQISKRVKENNWSQDSDFKAYLWASPSKHEFLSNAKSQGKELKSLECRLEGQYGYGRDRLNSIKEAGYFVGSFLLPELRILGRLGVNAYSISSTVLARTVGAGEALSWWSIRDIARYESLLAKTTSLKTGQAVAQVGLTAAATAQTVKECSSKIQDIKQSNLCSQTLFPENFDKIQSANNCLLSVAMTMTTAIVPTLGSLKNTKPIPSRLNEFSEPSPKLNPTVVSPSGQLSDIARKLTITERNRSLYSAQTLTSAHTSQSLIKAGRSQEAIWLMRENGLLNEADLLEAELKDAIAVGQEVRRTSTFFGSNNSGHVYLGPKLSGIFRSSYGYQHEVAAYKLDRLLGLNVVPLTVEKRIGDNVGSFQIWMPNTSTSWNPMNMLRFADQRHRRLLNYLINAIDSENPGNILFTRSNRVVAIDNQLSFVNTKFSGSLSERQIRRLIPKYEVYLKLKQVDETTLRQEILPHLVFSEAAFDEFLKRRAFLIKAIDEQIDKRGLENVFRE